MKRLTERHDHGIKMVAGYDFSIDPDDYDLVQEILARLAAYEDTGLEPEEVKDMAENAETRLLTWCESRYGFPVGTVMALLEAKQQGRLVVLPCKVGDVIYKPVHGIDGDGVWEIEVGTIDYNWHPNGSMTAHAIGTVLPDHGGAMLINMAYFGKDWFLTREEAERALEGGAGNG